MYKNILLLVYRCIEKCYLIHVIYLTFVSDEDKYKILCTDNTLYVSMNHNEFHLSLFLLLL